jgi:hypothetical protein
VVAEAVPLAPRQAVGVLTDGTAYFAPVGEVEADGDLVACHLCGEWRRSVTAHLRAHGWTKDAYCEAFGLERGQSLEGAATRKLRAASFSARLVFEPAVIQGSERGRAMARSGELASAAATAARGRRLPEQRRRKARQPMSAPAHAASAEANRARAAQRLAVVAAKAAAEQGYPDIGAMVTDQAARGASLAAISKAAGLHKDWLSRHLAIVAPDVTAALRSCPATAADARWLAAIGALGFTDVASYLRDRHQEQHQTVNQIAAEIGLSYQAVESALQRHRLAKVTHAASRHAAQARAERVAGELGFGSVAEYVTQRRAEGWTWSAMAAEARQPQTWLRRQGGPAVSPMPGAAR